MRAELPAGVEWADGGSGVAGVSLVEALAGSPLECCNVKERQINESLYIEDYALDCSDKCTVEWY